MYKIYFIYKIACIKKDVKPDGIMITGFIVKLERQILYTLEKIIWEYLHMHGSVVNIFICYFIVQEIS